jgi:hypothetical protein
MKSTRAELSRGDLLPLERQLYVTRFVTDACRVSAERGSALDLLGGVLVRHQEDDNDNADGVTAAELVLWTFVAEGPHSGTAFLSLHQQHPGSGSDYDDEQRLFIAVAENLLAGAGAGAEGSELVDGVLQELDVMSVWDKARQACRRCTHLPTTDDSGVCGGTAAVLLLRCVEATMAANWKSLESSMGLRHHHQFNLRNFLEELHEEALRHSQADVILGNRRRRRHCCRCCRSALTLTRGLHLGCALAHSKRRCRS